MRALRLPCIALAALLALALVNSLLLSRWCARWGDLLDAADACVQAEDWAGGRRGAGEPAPRLGRAPDMAAHRH